MGERERERKRIVVPIAVGGTARVGFWRHVKQPAIKLFVYGSWGFCHVMVGTVGEKSNVREREKLMNFWLSEERERGFLV